METEQNNNITQIVSDRRKKITDICLIIGSLLVLAFMIYMIINLELLRSDPCLYCTKVTGKVCSDIAQGFFNR